MNIDDIVFDVDTLDKEVEVEETQEETKEESTEIEDQNESGDTDETDVAPKAFFNALVDKGYFKEDPDFNGSYESLDEKIEELPQLIKESLLSQVNPEVEDVLHFILEGKQNLTREELIEFINAGNTEIETADDARNFLAEVYRKQGMKERAIEAQLDDLEEDNGLLEEAKKFANTQNENKIQEKQKLNRELEEQQTRFNETLVDEINNYPTEKQKQIKSTITNVGKIVGEISKDPKKYVKFVEVLSRYKNGEFDFSDIEKKGASNSTQRLKETLNKSAFSSASQNGASGSRNKNLSNLEFEI